MPKNQQAALFLRKAAKVVWEKTAFSTLLVDWYATQNTPLALIDMDSENKDRGSLGHFFPQVRKVNIQRTRGLDDFVHVLDEGGAVLSLPTWARARAKSLINGLIPCMHRQVKTV